MPEKANTIHPEALRVTRKRKNMTQEKLAEALKCSKDTVSRWERGTTLQVRPRLRDALCVVLRVKWEKLSEPPDETEDPWVRTKQISSNSRWFKKSSKYKVIERYGKNFFVKFFRNSGIIQFQFHEPGEIGCVNHQIANT